jgi:hypothetical protein
MTDKHNLMDDKTRKALIDIKLKLRVDIARMKHEITRMESHVQYITELIINTCPVHNMVIDYNNIEPCGSTPKICTICGYRT